MLARASSGRASINVTSAADRSASCNYRHWQGRRPLLRIALVNTHLLHTRAIRCRLVHVVPLCLRLTGPIHQHGADLLLNSLGPCARPCPCHGELQLQQRRILILSPLQLLATPPRELELWRRFELSRRLPRDGSAPMALAAELL